MFPLPIRFPHLPLACLICCFVYYSDVRVDAKLNKFLFSKGVRNVPTRVRVRLSRKRNEDEEATEKVCPRGWCERMFHLMCNLWMCPCVCNQQLHVCFFSAAETAVRADWAASVHSPQEDGTRKLSDTSKFALGWRGTDV